MAFNKNFKNSVIVTYTSADFQRESRFKSSEEMFIRLSYTIGMGKPKSVDDLFGDCFTEKDWWSRWYPLLELKDWADSNNGYNQLVPGHLSSEVKAKAHTMVEDWSDMLLQLLNLARQKWQSPAISVGQFIRAAEDVSRESHSLSYRQYMHPSSAFVSNRY